MTRFGPIRWREAQQRAVIAVDRASGVLPTGKPASKPQTGVPAARGILCGDFRGNGGHRKKDIAPERIRTSDLRFRKPLLYPAELRAHGATPIVDYSIPRPSAKIAGAGPVRGGGRGVIFPRIA